MSALKVLVQARRLLEAGWHQGGLAADADGRSVLPFSDEAVCFCSLGAMNRAGASIEDWDELARQLRFPEWRSLANWNDERGRAQAQVLARFDTAIADLEVQQNAAIA